MVLLNLVILLCNANHVSFTYRRKSLIDVTHFLWQNPVDPSTTQVSRLIEYKVVSLQCHFLAAMHCFLIFLNLLPTLSLAILHGNAPNFCPNAFQCFCLTVGNAMAKWLILARLIESVEPSLDWTTFWTIF